MALRQGSGRLIAIMLLVVTAGILVARSYYGKLNSSVDSRIIPARTLYEQYDRYALSGNYHDIFNLLDSISEIYRSIPHYAESFELGVIHNNRAAGLLTIALYGDSIPAALNPCHGMPVDSIIMLAETEIIRAINLYENWNSRFDGLEMEEIRRMIEIEFLTGMEHEDPLLTGKYLDNRVKEINNSLPENARRLSVCHTNRGLVYRYRGEYKMAVEEYELAIKLWDRNLDAENNLNKLLNKPIKKRNFIQRMFPPSRSEAATN